MTSHINENRQELVEIGGVRVDTSLSKPERIAGFVRQVRNPYCVLSGGMTVTLRFNNDGPTLEECLRRIVA